MAETILDMILARLDAPAQDQLGSRLNLPAGDARAGLKAAVPLLLGALERNTQTAEGALSLSRALERDHDGAVLDDLPGLLADPDQGHGAGILKHVLGKRRGGVEERLAEKTGMDPAAIGRLLELASPLVLGVLGRQRKEQGFGATQLGQYITEQREQTENGAGWLGIASDVLDLDDDSNVLDDLSRFVGNLLRKN